MKECLEETFQVYNATLDVGDYVPKGHLEKIYIWIFKQMKKKQRRIDREDRKYQRSLKQLIKEGKVVDTVSMSYVLKDIDPLLLNLSKITYRQIYPIPIDNAEQTENVTPLSENEASAGNVAQTENTEGDSNVEKREEK